MCLRYLDWCFKIQIHEVYFNNFTDVTNKCKKNAVDALFVIAGVVWRLEHSLRQAVTLVHDTLTSWNGKEKAWLHMEETLYIPKEKVVGVIISFNKNHAVDSHWELSLPLTSSVDIYNNCDCSISLSFTEQVTNKEWDSDQNVSYGAVWLCAYTVYLTVTIGIVEIFLTSYHFYCYNFLTNFLHKTFVIVI